MHVVVSALLEAVLVGHLSWWFCDYQLTVTLVFSFLLRLSTVLVLIVTGDIVSLGTSWQCHALEAPQGGHFPIC